MNYLKFTTYSKKLKLFLILVKTIIGNLSEQNTILWIFHNLKRLKFYKCWKIIIKYLSCLPFYHVQVVFLKGLSWFWLILAILDHIAILDFKLWQYLKGCKMFCLAHFWQLKTACLIFTLEKYLICKYLVLFHKRKEKINNMPWQLFISFQNDWRTRKKVEKKYYFPVSKCVENGRHQTGSDALVSPKKYHITQIWMNIWIDILCSTITTKKCRKVWVEST